VIAKTWACTVCCRSCSLPSDRPLAGVWALEPNRRL